jgi:hypothetical protein
MTQYKWPTTDGWEVLVGWDRPLQHFFVNIDRVCRSCHGDGGFGLEPNDADICGRCNGRGTEYLFNNLDDKTGMTDAMGGMTLEQVRLVLTEKLTVYQEGVIGMLILDQVGNVGNKIVTFEPYGEERKD